METTQTGASRFPQSDWCRIAAEILASLLSVSPNLRIICRETHVDRREVTLISPFEKPRLPS